jgi:hypothetical protein
MIDSVNELLAASDGPFVGYKKILLGVCVLLLQISLVVLAVFYAEVENQLLYVFVEFFTGAIGD